MNDFLSSVALEQLEMLNISLSGIEASFVFTTEGLVLASTSENEMIVDEVAATTAAIQALGTHGAALLQRGALEQIQVAGVLGNIVLSGIGDSMILVVLTQEHVNVGLLLHEIKRFSESIMEYIS